MVFIMVFVFTACTNKTVTVDVDYGDSRLYSKEDMDTAAKIILEGKLAEITFSKELMDGVIEEIFAVLKAAGQSTLWEDAESYRRDFYSQLLPSTAAHHASMLQDIQRGRRTEIDALNGAVVELGRKFEVDTPVNAVITALLKGKETMFLKPVPQIS